MTLPVGYHVVGRFEILQVIAQGGFGIAYWAYDKNFHREVCVKELFIPRSQRLPDHSVHIPALNHHDGTYFINNFLAEARKVANIRHENIVEVRDVFEANGTAYIVMEYIKGVSLSDMIKAEGLLKQAEAIEMFGTLCDAIKGLHNTSIIHRDIKPDNILIENETNRLVIIDFGNAKEMDSGTDTFSYLSNGYSAKEQYVADATKTFATDIYSLGATMYFALTGVQPLSAIDRITIDSLKPPADLNASIEEYLSNAVMRAMSVQSENRYQYISDFKNAILVKPTVMDNSHKQNNNYNNNYSEVPVTKKPPKKNRIFIILAITFLALLVGILIMLSNQKENIKLNANFEIPTQSIAGEIVALEQLSTGENLQYVWEFEGANIKSSTDESPQIIYSAEGDYKIKLTVKNEEGIETSSERMIRIESKINTVDAEKTPEKREDDQINIDNQPTGETENPIRIKESIIEIDVALKMTEQNLFTWNNLVANNGLKTTIIIEKNSSTIFTQDVTGKSYFKFKSMDTRFDGVNCNVELIIESNDNIKIRGNKKLRVKTTC
jgi:serine/threonine protein kinase